MPDKDIDAARAAVIAYARTTAKLASFPVDPWLERGLEWEEQSAPPSATLKLVTTDKLRGRVLPRPEDAWVAILPFGDLTKKMPAQAKVDLVQKRRGFLDLLVHLASCCRFCWGSTGMHCGESREDESTPSSSDQSFWIDLFRSLCKESAADSTKDLERHLIALSSQRMPKFLLCIDSDVTSGDTLDLVERFLSPVDKPDGACKKALASCGLDAHTRNEVVEVGLSFSKWKISPTFIARLYDIVDRFANASDSSETRLRVTSLRFSHECSFPAKTLETLGQRQGQSTAVHGIRLGSIMERKPSGLKRLAFPSCEDFNLVASVLRSGQSSLEELDIEYEPTVEDAAWLAFAFFHADSNSRVSTLRLRVPSPPSFGGRNPYPDEEWFATFKRVLGSVTAEQDLADMEEDSESQEEAPTRRFVKIKAKTPLMAGPYSSARQVARLDDTAEEFEAIAEASNFVAIIAPGIGVVWVTAPSVESEWTVPSKLAGRQGRTLVNGHIKSFCWDCPVDLCDFWIKHHSMHWLLKFLEVIGEPLTSLHLPVMKLQTDHLAQVLAHCPNLRELNVSGHEFESIQPLVEAYASGKCCIESLSLEPRVRIFQETTTKEMKDILQGPGGSTLRQLVIHLHPSTFRELRYLEEEILPVCQAISDSNTLQYVQLPGSKEWENRMTANPRVFPTEPSTSDPQLPLDLASRPIRVEPLKMRCKLAFLSVTVTTGRLDSALVAQIFAFSSTAVARRVIKNAPLALDHCFCKTCSARSILPHLYSRQAW